MWPGRYKASGHCPSWGLFAIRLDDIEPCSSQVGGMNQVNVLTPDHCEILWRPPDIFIHTLFSCILIINCSCCNVWQSNRNPSGLLPPAATSQPAITVGPRMLGFLTLFIHNYTIYSNFSKLLFCISYHREHIFNADGAFCSIHLLYLTCSESVLRSRWEL